ncbi:Dolichyl pyrophosphate Glc1Man9GlcNAc2 alpha-1,3-glucosyltransferase [Golovinomyces cichoracearum]|uniref:Alpha-1,3-glucosyltransferase n=1 Tax=Golovinomyces cichoracearum TaxID=62708 RepID=A0A420J2X7_9PEZI|nr:Dolichyl pyrophosphate Glc1Man9GlcNAc2 alpha-1,3-glucosyltransferase [Golovinomyces cichoracearum]
MAEIHPSIEQCAIVTAAFKLVNNSPLKLLQYRQVNSRSTDFEVHRNWLAITNSLPVHQWYFEETSQWTLDYPPFFAYFEWLLSQIACLVDPEMTKILNLGYDSWQTIYYQKSSVIATDLVKSASATYKSASHASAIAILLSPGFLIIDHIHFQYNGLLYGILLTSLILARRDSTILASGLIFAALLCFKHIYLYLAPAYFFFLLRKYCLKTNSIFRIRTKNCFKLAVGLILIFSAAFGPFFYWGQTSQLFGRLFPFSRGLCHAYWAPNFWALYSLIDRILIYVAPLCGLSLEKNALNKLTRGLVGDTAFAVLPEITSQTTFILTIISQLLPLIKLYFNPKWDNFIATVTLCGYSSFLFGWHVHEKAILLIIVPFSLLATKDRRYLCAFRPLAVAGNISLFPLIFTPAEFPIKTIYTIIWTVLVLIMLDRVTPASSTPRIFLLDRLCLLYIAASIPIIIYCSFFHNFVLGGRFEFLPLLLTSSYCAIGVIGSWLGLLVVVLTS